MLPREDLVRLRHMLDIAREARSYVAGRQREDIWQDSKLGRALTACLMIPGEAANSVSAATQQAHGEIAWSDIIAMRHKLIHAYFDLNLNIVWETVQDDLPVLIPQLEQLLSEEGGGGPSPLPLP